MSVFSIEQLLRTLLLCFSIQGAEPQVVQTSVCPHIPMELFTAPVGPIRIPSGQHVTAWCSVFHVLQVCELFFNVVTVKALLRITAVKRASTYVLKLVRSIYIFLCLKTNKGSCFLV